jgi:hypothetical protein
VTGGLWASTRRWVALKRCEGVGGARARDGRGATKRLG